MNLNELTALTASTIFHNIANAAGPLTGVITLLVFTALADVATGLYAAWQSHTLDIAYIDDFLRSHVAQRWAPIVGTLLGGIMIGGVDNVLGATLIAAATAQIVAYEVSTFGGSITSNLKAASTKTKGLPGATPLLSPHLDAQTIESLGLPVSNDPVQPAVTDTSVGSGPIPDQPFGEHPGVAPTSD